MFTFPVPTHSAFSFEYLQSLLKKLLEWLSSGHHWHEDFRACRRCWMRQRKSISRVLVEDAR